MNSPALLQYTFPLLDNSAEVSLSDYAGRVILVVNTASYCSFTRQYTGLEALYEHFKDQGLVVLGFPSNDFGGQEPDAPEAIMQFCQTTYQVQFPLLSKIHVKGPDAHPFYRALHEKTGSRPRWNFHKYVIYPDGEQVNSYSALTFPRSARFIRIIEEALSCIKQH